MEADRGVLPRQEQWYAAGPVLHEAESEGSRVDG